MIHVAIAMATRDLRVCDYVRARGEVDSHEIKKTFSLSATTTNLMLRTLVRNQNLSSRRLPQKSSGRTRLAFSVREKRQQVKALPGNFLATLALVQP